MIFSVSKICIHLYKKKCNFYIKNGNFLKTKSDQNVHQNAPNCTILKIFSGEHAPEPP